MIDKVWKFVIWGTGHYADITIDYLNEIAKAFNDFKYSIIAFIDSDLKKQGLVYDDKTIYSLDFINELYNEAIIIIAIYDYSEAEDYLKRRRYFNYITPKDFLCKENIVMCFLDKNDENYSSNSPVLLRNKARQVIKNYSISYVFQDFDTPFIYKISAAMSEFRDNFSLINTLSIKNSRLRDKSNKRKVVGVYYSRLYSGGVERVISVLLPLLLSRGYKVILFTNVISEKDYESPEEVDRCVIPYDEFVPYRWLEKFYEELINKKVNVLINHAHAAWISYYLGICAKYLGIHYIVESHTCKAAIKSKDEIYYKNIYSLADILVVLSMNDLKYWSRCGLRVKYIPNPVSLPDVYNCSSYNHKQLIWVGRIDVEEKNVYEVVPVIKRVAETIPDIKLYIIGNADDKNILIELKKRIRKNCLENNIVIEGYKKNLDDYYSKAALILVTSPYEGFPMALVESMSYGVPAVMYEIDGLELTKEGLGVVCVPQGDYEGLSKCIIDVLLNFELREKLSKEARNNIERFHEMDISGMWNEVITDR